MSAFSDLAAVDYDERIVARVPGYRLGQQLAAAILANRLGDGTHVLVVGCGTGEDLIALVRALPVTDFTAIDPSAGMLARAETKARQYGFANRVRFEQATAVDAPRETYHAALASLVLHFLRDDGAKAAFLKAVADRLCDGAPLVLIDPTDASLFEDDYRQWMIGQGLEVEAADDVMTRVRKDWFRATPERLADLVTEAGFEAPQVFFTALGYRGVVARRIRAS